MVSGPDFDQKMGEYLRGMREHSLTRRGLLKAAGGAAGAAALMGGAAPLLSGFGVLAADADTITYGLESDPRGVEPALAYDFTANVVVNNITEGLMRVDGQGKLQPHLAEKYDHPDPLTYIYTLRAGVKFHDGTPMTVADVLASIDRTRSNKTIASPMSWMFDSVASIDQSADNQITIKLKQPSGTFQFVASVTAMHVMPKSKIDANATQPILDPVGTGPYKFVKWDSGSEIDLVKNDAYWQTGKPHFKNVVFKIIGDPTTRITGLKTGDLNEVREILPDQLETVRALTNVQLLDVIGYTINMIVMVNDKPPFNDPKIREAVSLAVDVDSLLANLVKDAGIRSHATTVPPNMPGSASDQLQPVAFDLTKAKAALAASTMPDGFKTTLLVDAENSLRVAEAQAVQQMLKAINIDAEIKKVPQAERITAFQSGEYEGMAFHEWGADFPDANGMLLPLFGSRSFPPQNNQSKYSNPAVDKLLDGAEAEADAEKRTAILIEAQKLIAADMPLIWLDHPKWFLAMDKNLSGYVISPLFYWDSFFRDLVPA